MIPKILKIDARIKLFNKLSFLNEEELPFGKYLWSTHRPNVPSEKETVLEKKLYDDLKKHFSSKHIGIPKLTNKILQICLKNNWYQDVLHPPPYKFVYRGLKLSSKDKLSELLNIESSEINDSGIIKDYNNAVINNNGFSTSWSKSKKITSDFSTNYGKGKRGFAVTLIAEVNENKNKFIAGPGGLYDVEGLSRWHLEKETVGLEPIIIKKIEWKKL